MADLQALASFTNVVAFESATITLAHGITPSMARLTVYPQEANIRTNGDLTWWEGSTRMWWRDALADEARFRFNKSGQLIEITVLDRRWKWNFPRISGHYNVRDYTGNIFKDNGTGKAPDKKLAVSDGERTVKELIELCLKALGETGYQIDNIPDELRPEIHWEHEYAAQALQSLCSMVGCRVVLQLDNRIGIRKQGQGKALPPGPVEEYGAALDPPDKPSKLIAYCGPTWFQVDLELGDPVGMERTGEIKKIDDLSYKPSGGWKNAEPEMMEEIQGSEDRQLALEWVYRAYPFKLPADVKGFKGSPVKWPRQLYPVGLQVYTYKYLGEARNRRAIVWGEWFDPEDGESTTGSLQDAEGYNIDRTILRIGFEIDYERSLVKFNEPVYKLDDNSFAIPAKLKLRSAIQLRDATTGEWVRHSKELILDPQSNTKPREIIVDELRLDLVNGKEKNRDTVDKELQKRLDIVKEEYEFVTPETAVYTGWLDTELDGAIQSITWIMGPDGATTTIQRNDDVGSKTTQPYRLRRLNEEYAQGLRNAAKIGKQDRLPTGGLVGSIVGEFFGGGSS
jgi:hypothetical protein